MRDTSNSDTRQFRAIGDCFLDKLAPQLSGPEYGALWDELHDGRADTYQIVCCVMRIEKKVEDHTIKQQPLF